MSPSEVGRQGEELSAKEAIFAKLKVKAAKVINSIHPLIPPASGGYFKTNL